MAAARAPGAASPPATPPGRAADGPGRSTDPSGIGDTSSTALPPQDEHTWLVETDGASSPRIFEPFGTYDRWNLERRLEAEGDGATVSVDCGRHEVDLGRRVCRPVYVDGEERRVVRALWYRRAATPSGWEPFSEADGLLLERFYKSLGVHRRAPEQSELFLSDGESKVVARPPSLLLTDAYAVEVKPSEGGAEPFRVAMYMARHDGSGGRHGVVRGLPREMAPQGGRAPRGFGADGPEQGRPPKHLVLVVHGIGEALFSKEDTPVDSFRHSVRQAAGLALRQQMEKFPGASGRIEFLPIEWHQEVHRDMPLLANLKMLTLPSLQSFRDFNHDVLMDIVLFLSAPFKRRIMERVGASINAVYREFKRRNPTFDGSVSLMGFSLGSIIVFDLLANQPPDGIRARDAPPNPRGAAGDGGHGEDGGGGGDPGEAGIGAGAGAGAAGLPRGGEASFASEQGLPAAGSAFGSALTFGSASAGSLAPGARSGDARVGEIPGFAYPVLDFSPARFFAVGAPIGMFLSVRDELNGLRGSGFRFPTCPRFYNIFHPFDPVAYRLEPAFDPAYAGRPPVVVPHHAGGVRMHVQLQNTLGDSMASTIKLATNAAAWIAGGIAVEDEAAAAGADGAAADPAGEAAGPAGAARVPPAPGAGDSSGAVDGLAVNGRHRVDYVLQEAALETASEYLAALGSHGGYFANADVALFIATAVLTKDSSEASL